MNIRGIYSFMSDISYAYSYFTHNMFIHFITYTLRIPQSKWMRVLPTLEPRMGRLGIKS